MDTKRQQKVAQLIQEEFSELFRKQASDSEIKGTIITVTASKITSDLSISKIYLSIFPDTNRGLILAEIKENHLLYRKYLGGKLGKVLRIIPHVNFYLDTTLDDLDVIDKELKGLGNNPKL